MDSYLVCMEEKGTRGEKKMLIGESEQASLLQSIFLKNPQKPGAGVEVIVANIDT